MNFDEVTKAIQDSAQFGGKGLEVAEKVGGFITTVLKDSLGELGGIITDKLRFVRWKRLLEMGDEVNEILAARGVVNTRAVSPKLALPIFENSSLEEDAVLQRLWSQLLANAMDPNFNSELRYGFTEMITNITGSEARMLNELYLSLLREGKLRPIESVYENSFKKEQVSKVLRMSREQYALAVNNLMRLQLLSPAVLTGGIKMGTEAVTIYKGIDAVTLTPLAVKFIEACIHEDG